MELTIRERRQKVADAIKTNVKQSVRSIAKATGLSKSSVHRHRQHLESRQSPESIWWETREGYACLLRLVYGVIYFFGIKQGVGAETLSEFIQAVHLEPYVASSVSALRSLKQDMTQLIVDYGQAQSADCQPSAAQGIVLGGDETFFGLPILVLIELVSGYIFVETECANRTYATWLKQLQQWWDAQRWRCHYFVSDGARALIKLATSGLGCVSVPDVFHALRALGRPLGSALGRQSAQLTKAYDKLQTQLRVRSDAGEQRSLDTLVQENLAKQQQVTQDQRLYHETLEEITQMLHPFTRDTQQWQLGDILDTHLATPLKTLNQLAQAYSPDKGQQAIVTFRSQITAFVQGIDAWQQWVVVALQTETQERGLQDWVLSALLPWVYWTQQADKTRHTTLKHHYQQAACGAYDLLVEHPLTLTLDPTELERWTQWSQEFCAKYQRTSSAIEGRNGQLSKLHHNARGFSEHSLKALTIIHNFDIKRLDGSTPAQRLFGKPFPDLFEWLLDHASELPRPRKSTKAKQL